MLLVKQIDTVAITVLELFAFPCEAALVALRDDEIIFYKKIESSIIKDRLTVLLDTRLGASRGLSPNLNSTCAAAYVVAKMQRDLKNHIRVERVTYSRYGEKVSKCRFNGQAIAIAVLAIKKNPSRVECLRVYKNGQRLADYKIGATKIDGYPCFRWCGEDGRPDLSGSHSIIFPGEIQSTHSVYVTAEIAQRLYNVRDIRRVVNV